MILSLTGGILQLPACGLEGVPDRHVDVFMGARRRRLMAHVDVRGSRQRNVDTDAVGVALVMAVLWSRDDDAHRNNAIKSLVQLGRIVTNARLDSIRMINIEECHLEWNLQGGTSFDAVAICAGESDCDVGSGSFGSVFGILRCSLRPRRRGDAGRASQGRLDRLFRAFQPNEIEPFACVLGDVLEVAAIARG